MATRYPNSVTLVGRAASLALRCLETSKDDALALTDFGSPTQLEQQARSCRGLDHLCGVSRTISARLTG
jgi:hypothetical protein